MALNRPALQNLEYLPRLAMNSPMLPEIFRPPVNRSMRVLDRSFFQKTLRIAAATVFDNRNLSTVRNQVVSAGNTLGVFSIKAIVPDETAPGRKCILLRPGITATDPLTWSPTITELVEKNLVGLRPYDLKLNYDDWTMHNILEATLPELEEDEKETPAGFALVGHVAHLNLREQYLPYKHLIGQILLDKNPNVRTVINKIEDVGSTNPYRTFPYEVLAGPDDLYVAVSFAGCQFKFDFAKVYWNPRLHTEHERLINKFQEGEALCDVMAGVGPFAIPAGKNGVFVSANDLNPDSHIGLCYAIRKNKLGDLVTAECMDGRDFIRRATRDLRAWQETAIIRNKRKISRPAGGHHSPMRPPRKTLKSPRSFQHYVMNLPASAVEFLDAFRGLYASRELEFTPHTGIRLPMIHLYCFLEQQETEEKDVKAVCQLVSKHLGHEIAPESPDTDIHFVRKVSPKKKMFCASFRLPPEVAFGVGI